MEFIENDDADDPDETIVMVDEEQRLPLTLHRNSVIHQYQDVAIAAAASSVILRIAFVAAASRLACVENSSRNAS